jgi:IS4 transposase
LVYLFDKGCITVENTKRYAELLEITNRIISDVCFMLENRMKSTYFTRGTEKMDFKDLITFALNFVKKSLQIELDLFFKNIKGVESTMTKQAYSQARQKISARAFITLNEAVIKWFYKDDDFKTFRGYRLSAIDGSVLELNNSERLRNDFGYVENVTVKVARALSSGIYDIENNLMMTSKITRYGTSEIELATELIENLDELGLKNDLILFDRGYPSTKFINYLENKKIKYLMRTRRKFLKVITEATKADQIIEVKTGDQILKIRVIRFMLDSETEEVLITNLIDENFEIMDFKKLYFKRWGIEIKYNELKNRLQIENFTGDTKVAVEQDFYASIYLSNMAAIAKAEANQEVEQLNESKDLKYEYKVNTNILIGKLKDNFVMALLQDNIEERKKMVNKIMLELQKNTIPIRPDRIYERNMELKRNKHSLNTKRCL